jgi:hypothetical protein
MPLLPSAISRCCVNAGWGSRQILACSGISTLWSSTTRLSIPGSVYHFATTAFTSTLMSPSRARGKVLNQSGSWLICLLSINGQTGSCTPPPPLVDQKQEEPKMTPRLAALVNWVAELHAIDLGACHCAKEFTLRRIHPLGRRQRLAYDCPWLADLRHKPATGKMFNLHFYY